MGVVFEIMQDRCIFIWVVQEHEKTVLPILHTETTAHRKLHHVTGLGLICKYFNSWSKCLQF
jgi:hypothetical protein